MLRHCSFWSTVRYNLKSKILGRPIWLYLCYWIHLAEKQNCIPFQICHVTTINSQPVSIAFHGFHMMRLIKCHGSIEDTASWHVTWVASYFILVALIAHTPLTAELTMASRVSCTHGSHHNVERLKWETPSRSGWRVVQLVVYLYVASCNGSF
jgi:hypothetical protein